ncbi:Hsp70 family protein, partial [Mycolicibacterium arseniciresistens]
AVPAYWPATAVDAVQARMPHAIVVSDAVAALTALQSRPGLPARGLVLLCDVGATGTTLTLADAGAGFAPVGSSVRCDDFGGDAIDRAVLTHVLADIDAEESGTSAVASLTALRDECRLAKERLSFDTATGLTGPHAALRLTRAEVESLMREPVDHLMAAVFDLLQRNRVAPAQLAAVATVGGGARIPLVTQRLSEGLRLPVTTMPRPELAAAIGAALVARR